MFDDFDKPVRPMPGTWTDTNGGRHTVDIPDPDIIDMWDEDRDSDEDVDYYTDEEAIEAFMRGDYDQPREDD